MADNSGGAQIFPGIAVQTGGANPASSFAGGLGQGMQLAQMQQQLQQQRDTHNMQKAQFQTQAAAKYFDLAQKAAVTTGPVKDALMKQMQLVHPMTGLADDTAFQTAVKAGDPDTAKLSGEFVNQLSSGKPIDPSLYQAGINLFGGDMGKFLDAKNKALDTVAKVKEAEGMAGFRGKEIENMNNNYNARLMGLQQQAIAKITNDPLIRDTEKANTAGVRVQQLLSTPNPRWADMTETVAGLNQIISGSTRAAQSREAKLDLNFLNRVKDTIESKVNNHEVGGPSPEELNIWKSRVDRILSATQQQHDAKLDALAKDYENQLPAGFFDRHKLVGGALGSVSSPGQAQQFRGQAPAQQTADQTQQAQQAPTQVQTGQNSQAQPAPQAQTQTQTFSPNAIQGMLNSNGPQKPPAYLKTKAYLISKGYSPQQADQAISQVTGVKK